MREHLKIDRTSDGEGAIERPNDEALAADSQQKRTSSSSRMVIPARVHVPSPIHTEVIPTVPFRGSAGWVHACREGNQRQRQNGSHHRQRRNGGLGTKSGSGSSAISTPKAHPKAETDAPAHYREHGGLAKIVSRCQP